jgi:glycerophosphoryl diester phosphodiesterase
MNRISTKITHNILNSPLIKANISTLATYYKAEGRPLNIAHRGLAAYFPENTIPAFEAALYAGADFIELDVVYTKENRLLVMHDPFLHRITNAMVEDFPHAF